MSLDDDIQVLNLTLAQIRHAAALAVREVRQLKEQNTLQQQLIDQLNARLERVEKLLLGTGQKAN